MTTVLDASFAINMMTTSAGAGLNVRSTAMAEQGLRAPVIFWHETASGLRSMVLRGSITTAYRATVLQRLRALDIELEELSSNIEPVIAISERYQLSVYDAAYLELASRTESDLATSDSALIQAAPRAGVRLAISQ